MSNDYNNEPLRSTFFCDTASWIPDRIEIFLWHSFFPGLKIRPLLKKKPVDFTEFFYNFKGGRNICRWRVYTFTLTYFSYTDGNRFGRMSYEGGNASKSPWLTCVIAGSRSANKGFSRRHWDIIKGSREIQSSDAFPFSHMGHRFNKWYKDGRDVSCPIEKKNRFAQQEGRAGTKWSKWWLISGVSTTMGINWIGLFEQEFNSLITIPSQVYKKILSWKIDLSMSVFWLAFLIPASYLTSVVWHGYWSRTKCPQEIHPL